MIPVAILNSLILSRLDAEGSDRYLFDQDIKPAINSAIDISVSLFNAAFASNKISPEQLRDLLKVRVWQASQYSRIAYKTSELNEPLWTIVAIYPKPTVNRIASSSALSDKSTSKFRSDLSYVKSDKSAKRLTLEEWNDNKLNVFMPGNTILKGGLSEYAYLDFANYQSTSYTGNEGEPEIEIRPEIPGELVAMAYLKSPQKVTVIGDNVEFPESMTQMIVDISLNVISVKQGDSTTLYSISAQNIQMLASLFR